MISKKEETKLSKLLSLVLRHKPETIGLELSEEGWAETAVLIDKLNANNSPINLEILTQVVENNAKKRFAFNDKFDKIRASQGHSIEIELGYDFDIDTDLKSMDQIPFTVPVPLLNSSKPFPPSHPSFHVPQFPV